MDPISRRLSAAERRALSELADLAGASAADKRRMPIGLEARALGELADLTGANASEKWRMPIGLEPRALGELADLAGVNAAEKRYVVENWEAPSYGAAYGASGRKSCTGHRFDSSLANAHGRGNSRSTYL